MSTDGKAPPAQPGQLHGSSATSSSAAGKKRPDVLSIADDSRSDDRQQPSHTASSSGSSSSTLRTTAPATEAAERTQEQRTGATPVDTSAAATTEAGPSTGGSSKDKAGLSVSPTSARMVPSHSSPLPPAPQTLPSKPVVLDSAFDMIDAVHGGNSGLGMHGLPSASASYSLSVSPNGRASSVPNGANIHLQSGYPYHQGTQRGPRANGSPHLWQGAPGTKGGGSQASTGSTTGVANAAAAAAYNDKNHCRELTSCIIAFLGPILPTEEEYRVKEATRRQLERLAGKVSPGAKLLAFGSMANGFALRNSDMDLCCLTAESGEPQKSPAELVEILGALIREETDFIVMPLPKARIPIIKIKRAPTPDLPYEIACDIGFENRLALENTRLLLSYAMVDPPRLRTMVLFLKVWTKRRKLNSPFTGTLSSYGYTLMALYFLTHVKKPPVLPNLQRIPPSRPLAPSEAQMEGNDDYFYDDIATLRNEWQSSNTENVGELLLEFFRYFARDFGYAREVISLRSEFGTLPKDGVLWTGELCIEDPFQVGYNVSRPVTKDGLYTIRGEFIRASRILSMRNQRPSTLIAELCQEREEGLARAPEGPRYPRYQPATYHQDLRRQYNNASGIGGSFAFEAMARGLGKGQQIPTTAMLAPLSHNTGLTGKTHKPQGRRKTTQNVLSAESRQDAKNLQVPSSTSGSARYSLDQAIDMSTEASPDHAARASRSFSDTLARSKSVPRQQMPPVPNGAPRHSQPPSPMTRPRVPQGSMTPPVQDLMAGIDTMSVGGAEMTSRSQSSAMSDGGAFSDSPYADISTRSSPFHERQYVTHAPWNFLVPSVPPLPPAYARQVSGASSAAKSSPVYSSVDLPGPPSETGHESLGSDLGSVVEVSSAPEAKGTKPRASLDR